MNEPAERAESYETLLESLIKMLGKSNEKVDELAKRVHQLELYLRESSHIKQTAYSFFAEIDNSHQEIPS